MGSLCNSTTDETDLKATKEPRKQLTNEESKKEPDPEPELENEKNKKIVIIGAGPAGIHMASKLLKAGYQNIKILEKTNRICGKSYTFHDSNKHEELLPFHELGTCYMHPEYFVIDRLLAEYDPNNKPIEVPSRSAFGTHLNDNIENKAEQTGVSFGKWVLDEVESTSVPKALQWVSQEITATLSLTDAINRYCEIHREIFGKQQNNEFYGFLNKPSPKNLESLNCTMLEWLIKNDLPALVPNFVYTQSIQGYGTLDKVPAFYGLFWNTPELLEQVFSLRRKFVTKNPAVVVLSKGFESLWNSMVEKHNMDIILNCNVSDINRHLNDESKAITIKYQIMDDDGGDSKQNTQEMECDYLFLACGCKRAVDEFLNDATEQEKEVFLPLKPYTLCTTLYESDIEEKQSTAVEIWPGVIWKADGTLYAQRNSYITLYGHDKYTQLVDRNVIKRDRAVAYQFVSEPPPELGPAENEGLLSKLKNDLDIWGEKNVEIVKQTCWDYFPIWNNECIMKGYPWIVKDEMQGKYKNTYYIGSSVCFEAVLCVCEYNNELFDNFIKQKMK